MRSCAAAGGDAFAVIAAGPWGDADLSTTVVAPPTARAGLVLRYASPDDCYLWRLDGAAGSHVLVRRRGGVETHLAGGAWSHPSGGAAVQLEVVGGRLRGRVGEALCFNVFDDGALAGGTVGAWASSSDAVEFLPFELRHAAPAWSTWHAFGVEGRRVSGRRFRIVAGVSPAGGPVSSGEELRWKGISARTFQ